MMTKKNEHVIKEVYPGSIAQEMEIEPGDILLSINHEVIEDVFDYRYLIKDEYIEVVIRKPDGEEWLLEIDKEYDDDLGVEFENGLMSDYRSCSNKCIFCFIDQMPPGMRETLYFKDDDSRLSMGWFASKVPGLAVRECQRPSRYMPNSCLARGA